MDLVVALVAANGGRIVGKTRLQKTVYLLDALGLESGFDFEFHNYGPFSAELAFEADAAEAAGLVDTETKQGFHEVPYVVYKSDAKAPDQIGRLDSGTVAEKLRYLGQHSAIVLELAASIQYFKHLKDRQEMDHRVRQLKPLKATPERLEKAWSLLGQLGLAES
jgi:uncharacterized protein YwgA